MKKFLIASLIATVLIITTLVIVVTLNKTSIERFLWEERCKKNDGAACFQLAYSYHTDTNNRDYEKAKKFYKIGCDKNHYDSCLNYGYLFMDGDGGTKDIDITITYYKKACEGKKDKACMYLGVIYATSVSKRKNLKRAIKYGLQACEIDKRFCFVGAYYLLNGQVELAKRLGIAQPQLATNVMSMRKKGWDIRKFRKK
jgi:TPR repeat protein